MFAILVPKLLLLKQLAAKEVPFVPDTFPVSGIMKGECAEHRPYGNMGVEKGSLGSLG